MANTKSAIKAARKTVRFTLRNRTVKTNLKTLLCRVSRVAVGRGRE